MAFSLCRMAGCCRREDGAAAVEFAILVPVYLLFVTGILAYGIYFGAAHSVQQIAADAVRTSIAGLNSAERAALVTRFLDNNASGYVFIDRKDLSFSITDGVDDPDEFRLTVHYAAADLPIWNLYVPLPLPSRTITYSSSIRMGGI